MDITGILSSIPALQAIVEFLFGLLNILLLPLGLPFLYFGLIP